MVSNSFPLRTIRFEPLNKRLSNILTMNKNQCNHLVIDFCMLLYIVWLTSNDIPHRLPASCTALNAGA